MTAHDFLAAVLETVAQPIWVVDPDGAVRFVNPAALAALGYDDASELIGHPAHATLHRTRPDGTSCTAVECPLRLQPAAGETAARELDWLTRRDGSTLAVSYVSVPLEMPHGCGAVVSFTDVEQRVRGEREREGALAALRRVATLVAASAAPADVFAAVSREVAHVLGLSVVELWRFGGDGSATLLGAWSEGRLALPPRPRRPHDGTAIAAQAVRAGRAVRIDGRRGAVAGAPIVVDGDVWGAIATHTSDGSPLPGGIEDRLAELTPMVAAVFSNTAGRDELARLAEEQAALRRVATLVARESPPAEIFAAVAEEVGRILRFDITQIYRFEADGTATAVAGDGPGDTIIPVGAGVTLEGHNLGGLVLRTERPARIEDYAEANGHLGDRARDLGVRSGIGAPIIAGGRVWGAICAVTKRPEPLPADTESRMGEFTDLIATAISNIQARSDLAASRARIVAAADDERRRVVRDLHDGAQQSLVNIALTLKLATHALEAGEDDVRELLAGAGEQAERANAELRELAHGILPAVLTRGGLRSGVAVLASRMPVPVQTDVTVGRLPPGIEATAYFVVAEALTNVTKHSRAERADVTVQAAGGTLRIRVRDDGVGGVRSDGTGLVGLKDRLAVVEGRLTVESPAEGGTVVAVDIPLGF